MPESRKNIRVIVEKPKEGEIALRHTGVSRDIRLPVEVLDKASATPAVKKLAAMILDSLMQASTDLMLDAGPTAYSQMILQGGGRIIGIEVTGLKFKLLYAVPKGADTLFLGYTSTEV
jgi:hypothetical protein